MASVEDVLALDVRVGTIIGAEVLQGARRPAFALRVDFGLLGVKSASAEVSDLYEPSGLVGLQVVAVVNLPPERVAGLQSQVLVLLAENGRGERVLVMPERPVPDGSRVA